MNLMMMLNLTLWAYSLALEDSYFASVIFLFVQLVFQGIRELSVALADPYGDDDADFPLDDWMTQLYVRLAAICEDPYDPKEHSEWEHTKALKRVKAGAKVIDLLVDHASQATMRKKKQSQVLSTVESDDENAQESPSEDEGDARTVGAGGRKSKNGYTQVP